MHIGKAHRPNLQRGTEVPKKEPEPEPIIFEEPIFHHPSADVEPWMCRWPTEEPGKYGLHICGKTVQPGRYYCAEHCTAHYLPRRRSKAAPDKTLEGGWDHFENLAFVEEAARAVD